MGRVGADSWSRVQQHATACRVAEPVLMPQGPAAMVLLVPATLGAHLPLLGRSEIRVQEEALLSERHSATEDSVRCWQSYRTAPAWAWALLRPGSQRL